MPGAISIVTSFRTMCTLTTSPGVSGGSAAGNGCVRLRELGGVGRRRAGEALALHRLAAAAVDPVVCPSSVAVGVAAAAVSSDRALFAATTRRGEQERRGSEDADPPAG